VVPLVGQARRIRAGSYEIEAGATPRSCWTRWCRATRRWSTVRLIEGWTLRQLRAPNWPGAPHLKPATAAMDEASLMAALGAPGRAAEGRFFPDTYAYSRGVSDLTVLQARPPRDAARLADAAWAERARHAAEVARRGADPGLDRREGNRPAADRGLVAGVFVNRLRIGMPLQTDPTVIYGLGEAFDGNLRKRDLLADTPFNTYTRARPAADADRDAGAGLAARRGAARADQGAVLRGPRRRQQRLQREPGRAQSRGEPLPARRQP
jgi:UPF0755 protein